MRIVSAFLAMGWHGLSVSTWAQGWPTLMLNGQTDRVVSHEKFQIFDGNQLWFLEYRSVRRVSNQVLTCLVLISTGEVGD